MHFYLSSVLMNDKHGVGSNDERDAERNQHEAGNNPANAKFLSIGVEIAARHGVEPKRDFALARRAQDLILESFVR